MTRKQELYPEIIKTVTDSDIWSINDLMTFLPIEKSTFYQYYPSGSEQLESIKKQLELNKLRIKQQIRKRLLDSDSTVALIAVYKLICSREEHDRLSSKAIVPAENDDNEIQVTIEIGNQKENQR